MRKKKLFVWFMVFIITLSLFGCQESESTPKYPDAEGVDPAVALTLRKDYLQQLRSEEPETEMTLADIYVQAYYGTYSGCEIVYMGTSPVHTGQLRSVVVAGYIITLLGGGHKLYVHKDTHFYTLNEAYDAGYITTEDVEDFGPKVDKHYFRKWNGEVFSEDDNRIIHNPGWADVESRLREDYLRQFGSKYPEIEITLDKISVCGYCGTYSGCEIVYMGAPLESITVAERSVIVGGYIFIFEGDQKLYVHKDSHFYTIKEAYDAGYITTEDVAAFGPKVNNKFRKWDG